MQNSKYNLKEHQSYFPVFQANVMGGSFSHTNYLLCPIYKYTTAISGSDKAVQDKCDIHWSKVKKLKKNNLLFNQTILNVKISSRYCRRAPFSMYTLSVNVLKNNSHAIHL